MSVKTALSRAYLAEGLPILLHQFPHHVRSVHIGVVTLRLIQKVLDIFIGSFQDEIYHGQCCELYCCVGKLLDTRGDI